MTTGPVHLRTIASVEPDGIMPSLNQSFGKETKGALSAVAPSSALDKSDIYHASDPQI